jgi:dienelactone hydrolase
MKRRVALAAALALAAAGCATQRPGELQRSLAEADKVPDTEGTGPYPALTELDPELEGYVVFRPRDLSPFAGGKLGVFVWGNGACAADGTSARQHLAEIASHGYLVIAPGGWKSGPNAREPRDPPRPPSSPFETPTTATDLAHALDWAIAEHGRTGSRYLGLIDAGAIALGGFSCGGIQALRLADDPRVDTLVIQNSGILNEGSPGGEMAMSKHQLEAIHTPVLYLLGGESDIAYANGMDDFARIAQIPAMMVNLPVGHGGTYHEPNGGKAAGIVVDWLEWHLRGRAEPRAALSCPDGKWCRDPQVTIERKNFR